MSPSKRTGQGIHVTTPPSPPRLLEYRLVTRIIARHPPMGGGCDGCTVSDDTSVLVAHTTWGFPWESHICATCADKVERVMQGLPSVTPEPLYPEAYDTHADDAPDDPY